MTEKLTEGMNPEQAMATRHGAGPILVAAVAGSGKTRVLVHRIAMLVAAGILAGRILAVTFSRRAAGEMNERLKLLLPGSEARVGTFHSLAYEIMRAEKPEYKSGWTVDAKNRYRFCIKDAVGYKHMNWKGADLSFLESFISFAKSELLLSDDPETLRLAETFARKAGKRAPAHQMVRAYHAAEELRIEKQLITFDDMMLEGVMLLRDNEDIRVRWAGKWDYVLQDEAQDQSRGQLLMGELLAKDHKNYMLVGDTSQAIYGFRGAHPETLVEFPEKWDASVVNMVRNYRCAPEIVACANGVLESMDPNNRVSVDPMVAESSVVGEVTSVEYINLDEEGENVAAQCKTLHADGGEAWKDMAVMYRTNAQSRAVEEAMIGLRIPYRIIGGTNFYERKEVRDLLAYLRIAEQRATLDDIRRAINTPFRFLGKAFVDKVTTVAKHHRGLARSRGESIDWSEVVRDACNEAHVQYRQANSANEWADLIAHIQVSAQRKDGQSRPAVVLADIVDRTRYMNYLTKQEGDESVSNSRVSNVREMIRAAERFETLGELLDYVDDTIAASKKRRGGNDPDKVVLQSIHSSKGLEYNTVFLIGANEGILPHARAEDVEEERRLFYVGVTRAKSRLHVSCVQEAVIGGKVKMLSPSRFCSEANMDMMYDGD